MNGNMRPQEVFDALQKEAGSAILLDVRTPEEYKEGYAQGAVNIPISMLPSRLDELKKYTAIYTICQHGLRSASAADMLRRTGQWGTVGSVAGGVIAWERAGLPLGQ